MQLVERRPSIMGSYISPGRNRYNYYIDDPGNSAYNLIRRIAVLCRLVNRTGCSLKRHSFFLCNF
jgi:hypothetical protein